jgi:hypothetical protein
MPIPTGTPTGPSGPAHPGGSPHDHHPPWSPTQPRTAATPQVLPPRAAARSCAHSAAASDGAPHAGLACLVPQLARAAAARTHPARVRHRPPLTNAPPRQHRPRPGLLGRRSSRSTTRQPTRTSTRSCGTGCPPHRPGPQHHRPVWEEMDASGPTEVDSSRLDGWTPDGRTPDGLDTGRAGHRTAGHRTAGPPDPGRRHRTGGHHMVDTDRRPTSWQASWPCRPRRGRPTAGCWLDAPPGSRPSGRPANQDSAAARTTGTGPVTAATVGCRCYAAVQLAPGRTALLRKGWGRE